MRRLFVIVCLTATLALAAPALAATIHFSGSTTIAGAQSPTTTITFVDSLSTTSVLCLNHTLGATSANLRSTDAGTTATVHTSLLLRQSALNAPNTYYTVSDIGGTDCTYRFFGTFGGLVRVTLPLLCDWQMTATTVTAGTFELPSCTTFTFSTGPLSGCIATLDAQSVPFTTVYVPVGSVRQQFTVTANLTFSARGCSTIRAGRLNLTETFAFPLMRID
ncbi:MAG TPA: hypothetical protein VI111_10420 [Thermoleophilaceae bacterium]